MVNMLNVYGPGLAILFVVFVEAAGVFWLYGTENFVRDIEKMLGHKPGLFWRMCWKYISPIFLLVSLFLFLKLNLILFILDNIYIFFARTSRDARDGIQIPLVEY